MSIFKTKSGYGSATFLERLCSTWIKPFIERSHQTDKLISFDECGALRKQDELPPLLEQLKSKYSQNRKLNKKTALLKALAQTMP